MEEQLQLAYLAGLFDGEGTVTLSLRSDNSRFRFPTLSMSSTTLSLLELCQEIFGGVICKHKVYQSHHRQSWTWKIRNHAALEATRLLSPYIREPEKKRRMELLITRYEQVTVRNGKYSQSQAEAKLLFEQEFFHPSNAITEALGVL